MVIPALTQQPPWSPSLASANGGFLPQDITPDVHGLASLTDVCPHPHKAV